MFLHNSFSHKRLERNELDLSHPNFGFWAKRIGRPPLGPDMRASTVYLPEAAFVELETLAGKSGKKGFKRPGLSETVRAVIRLVSSREWSLEEIREAFSEPPEE
jgi:hypothetical protein